MSTLPRPDLPVRHPQNVKLSEWSDGWLKMSVASLIGAEYMFAYDAEKIQHGWPVNRQEMIDFLIKHNDIPEAGI